MTCNRWTDAQRALPALFVEHDTPREHPTDTLHPVQDPNVLLVHVTPFNALMWDNGVTPTRVIEHGVRIPDGVEYRGTLPKGVTVVNNIARRGRCLGADLFEVVRHSVPLDLVGIGSNELGGIGEVPNPALPQFLSHYRFFFNPIRYASLGLAVIEAMTIGLPIVALATTEMAQLVKSGCNGVADTRPAVLIDAMRMLIRDPDLAREWARRRSAMRASDSGSNGSCVNGIARCATSRRERVSRRGGVLTGSLRSVARLRSRCRRHYLHHLHHSCLTPVLARRSRHCARVRAIARGGCTASSG